jgi:hypothetical protein
VAVGDLAKDTRGLVALQVTIDETQVRVHLPATIVLQSFRMAQALATSPAQREDDHALGLHRSTAREHNQLIRACTIVVLLYLFFSRGGA